MAISAVVDLTGSQPDLLVQDLLASNAGISVVSGSVSLLASGPGAVNVFDAVTGASLGLASGGVLLTSGATPGTSNSLTWYGSDNSGATGFDNGDADIDAVVNTVFQTQSYDATTLSFNFNVADPAATSISFDLVFGSEEYPEWVDAFVDCAVVIVDGVNYALFNKDPNAPLSVISPNLAAGYFQDNASGTIPIEYDGVSGLLRIVAPLAAGLSTHTIKIGIADTGDHILDSGLFIANMRAGTDPGSGVVSNPGGGSAGNDTCTGSSKDEYFDLQAGDDTVYAGGGADIVVAGAGNDQVFAGSGDDELKGDGGTDFLDGGADLDTAVYASVSSAYAIGYDPATDHYTVDGLAVGEGVDTLMNIEQLMFKDGLFTLAPAGLSAVAAPPSPTSANGPGTVLITDAQGDSLVGPAAPDATLQASVIDPDGLSGGVAYQWLRDGVALASADASSYVVQEADLGHFLSVAVTYSDGQGQQENHTSQSLLALPANGDLLLTLMSIEGPSSASVYTPITTLLLRAIDLGETPNTALQKIRFALNVPQEVGSLLSTNAYNLLQAGNNATALALAKLEAQVAILCSSANDQSGLQLAQSLLALADQGVSIDLASATDLSALGWINPSALDLISQRNGHIKLADSLQVGGDSIQNEWLDFISNWDLTLADLPLSILSHAINQAPQGVPTAELPHLQAGQQGFVLSAAQLIEGLNDPDADPLSIQWLSTDQGDWFVPDPATGNWLLDVTAAGYTPDYVGPLELSYGVDDGHGHQLVAHQMLVVEAVNHLPSGSVMINVAGGGAPAQYATLQASDSLADLDGISGAISYAWYAGSTLLGTGGSLQLAQMHVGQNIHVRASYLDGLGKYETVSSLATAPVANVDDAPTGGVVLSSSATPKVGDVLSASHTVGDLDGIPLSGPNALAWQWQSTNGVSGWADLAGATSSSLLIGSALAGLQLRAVVRYTDLFGQANQVDSVATSAVVGVGVVWSGTSANDTKSGTIWNDSLYGVGGADKLSGLAGNDWLDGGAGIDTLVGGQGDDTYVLDNASDLITELAGEGVDTAQATVTYSLLSKAANVESLQLLGSTAINGTGNALANTLIGNSAANVLDGGAASDTLTGGAGADTFRISSLGNSLLTGFDRITDFAIGTDLLDGPVAVTAANLKDNVGVASALTASAIQAVLTSTNFLKSGAATFTVGTGPAMRTFLGLNDGTAGFDPTRDAIVEITGYSGSLANLAVM